MAWGSLWRRLVDFYWKYRVLSNVWKTNDFCSFFMGWRVSGGTWSGTLGGLGCKVAGWGVSASHLGGVWRRLGGRAAGWLTGRRAPG